MEPKEKDSPERTANFWFLTLCYVLYIWLFIAIYINDSSKKLGMILIVAWSIALAVATLLPFIMFLIKNWPHKKKGM